MRVSRTDEACERWSEGLTTDIARPVAMGMMIIAVALGGGGLWAATAPLSGAVVVSGVVVAAGHNKAIQHLEGGIVEEVLVREGDRVTKGDVIVRLSRTAAEAAQRSLEDQQIRLALTRARLVAERDGRNAFQLPELVQRKSHATNVVDLLAGQFKEFAIRREAITAQISVIEKQKEAKSEEILGLEAQKASVSRQAELIGEELQSLESLFKKGLVPKSRILALKRSAAELQGNVGELTSRIAETRAAMAECDHRINSIKNDWREKVSAALAEADAKFAEVSERLTAARDIASRVEIRTSVSGTIVTLNTKSIGGVVSPGQTIAEILPLDDGLEIEARVNPPDIERVTLGGPAQIRFVGATHKMDPSYGGVVDYVSADRLVDPHSQQSYYAVRIRLRQERPGYVAAGMPVEAFLETQKQTFFQYLIKPVSDSFMRAFREG